MASVQTEYTDKKQWMSIWQTTEFRKVQEHCRISWMT